MSRLDGFNRIAGSYDTLKRIVFGASIYKSQIEFLHRLSPGGNLLIIGGGSGEILRVLFQCDPEYKIWFVEASSEMLKKAAKTVPDDKVANIQFIHGTERTPIPDVSFDGIITNFFLDLFPDNEVLRICRTLKGKLKDDGVWLVSDFVDTGRWWQSVLLRTMYSFFVVTCDIEARRLPGWQEQLRLTGFEVTGSRSFYRGFIKSSVYRSND